MTARKKDRRVLFNDDGWIMGAYGPPLTVDQMRDNMIAPYEGTPVDTFLWSIGGHEVYDYETEVGELFGEGYEDLGAGQKRKYENLRHMIKENGGPITVIADLCREAGLSFFPSVRMNEHYDMDESAPNYGRLRREHPELLIGRTGEEIPDGSLEWGIRTGLNYAFPEVRAHMTKIIFELFERFDVDGIELDFMRHPAFFRMEEAYANRYLMTDMIDHIHQRMNQVGAERGKKLELAARVPPTLADSKRIGLDAEVWIKEGLIDILIAGGGFIPFEMPIAEFVEAAKGTDCQVCGCFEALRPFVDEELLRAAAARYWRAGVDGIYLFNYFSMSNEWRRSVLAQMADPDTLVLTDKLYELDYSDRDRPTSQLWYSFRNAIPFVQLPVTLDKTLAERGAILRMDIADDMETVTADGTLLKCILVLGFEDIMDGDEIEVGLNQVSVPWKSGKIPSNGWSRREYERNQYPATLKEVALEGDSIEFQIASPPLKQGVNELEVRLVKSASERTQPVVLKGVRFSITYK